MVILALITGLMAVGRYFGGEFVHRFDQSGVLLGSAIFTAIGIFLLSISTGAMAYFAAIIFEISPQFPSSAYASIDFRLRLSMTISG